MRSLLPHSDSRVKPPIGCRLNNDPINRGLVGYWLMNEGAGYTINDLSGNGKTGTFSGSPAWVSSNTGMALDFVRADLDYIQLINLTPSWDNGITIVSRFKLDAYATSAVGPIYSSSILVDSCGAAPYNDQLHSLLVSGTSNGKMTGTINWDGTISSGNRAYVSGATVVSLSGWHVGAMTYDRSAVCVYLDGIQDGTAALTAAMYTTTRWNIARFANASITGYWDGIIDWTRIYNRALSASEIARLYREPFGGTAHDPIEILGALGSGGGGMIVHPGMAGGMRDLVGGLAA